MELLIEFLAELLLQLVGETLVELGLHSVAEPFRKERNPWFAAVGYLMFGALLGAFSLWVLPHHLTTSLALRYLTLLVAPVATGVAMVGLGRWRARRGDPVLRVDRFVYAYLFALGLAVVRFVFAN